MVPGIWKHGLLLSARGNPGGVVGNAKSALVRGARDARAGTAVLCGRAGGCQGTAGMPVAAHPLLPSKAWRENPSVRARGEQPRQPPLAAKPCRGAAAPTSEAGGSGGSPSSCRIPGLPSAGAPCPLVGAGGHTRLSLPEWRCCHARAGGARDPPAACPRSRPARRVPAPSPCCRCRWLYPLLAWR